MMYHWLRARMLQAGDVKVTFAAKIVDSSHKKKFPKKLRSLFSYLRSCLNYFALLVWTVTKIWKMQYLPFQTNVKFVKLITDQHLNQLFLFRCKKNLTKLWQYIWKLSNFILYFTWLIMWKVSMLLLLWSRRTEMRKLSIFFVPGLVYLVPLQLVIKIRITCVVLTILR